MWSRELEIALFSFQTEREGIMGRWKYTGRVFGYEDFDWLSFAASLTNVDIHEAQLKDVGEVIRVVEHSTDDDKFEEVVKVEK